MNKIKERSLTSVIILIITIFALFSKFLPWNIGVYIFDLFALFIMIIASLEISNLMNMSGRKVSKNMTTIYCVLYYIVFIMCQFLKLEFYVYVFVELLFLILYFVASCIVEFIKEKERPLKLTIKTGLYTAISCFYPAFCLGLVININHADYFLGYKYFSFVMISLAFVIQMLTDTMAYLVGSKLRGPKLAPDVSPNKTISGAVGGLVGSLIGCVAVYFIVRYVPFFTPILEISGLKWWTFVIIGALGSIICQAGDLFESRLKRMANVKDSGTMFPGHGGMLDRVDGLIFVILFIYIVVALILV